MSYPGSASPSAMLGVIGAMPGILAPGYSDAAIASVNAGVPTPADMCLAALPPRFQQPNGSALVRAMGAPVLDALSRTTQAIYDRFPGQGDPSQLVYLGHDHQVTRGRRESDASYAHRITTSIDDWRSAGSAQAICQQVQAYYLPAVPIVMTVDNSGRRWTRDAAGAVVTDTVAWDWDGDAASWWRFWVIIYTPDGLYDFTRPRWGAFRWGDGSAYGFSDPTDPWGVGQDVIALRQIVGQWKAAHTQCENIIFVPPGSIAFPNPTGNWNLATNRDTTFRYADGIVNAE